MMAARTWWHVAAAVAVVVVVVAPPPAASCSCHLRHPQQHVCKADYVVFARVRRFSNTPGREAYKVRVKRLVKGSEKVEVMLQKGLLYTVPSSCEAQLLPRKSYVITGKVADGKPWVTLCDFASPVRSLTPKMKKGFKLLYKSGCDCTIESTHDFEIFPMPASYCSWNTSFQQPDCQGRQSVCLRGRGGRCEWLQGRLYRHCMKVLHHHHNRTAPPTRPRHNSIHLGLPGFRRRKLSKFAYKGRLGLRRRFGRPRMPIGYVPRKG